MRSVSCTGRSMHTKWSWLRGIAERAGVEFHVMDTSFIGSLGSNSLTDTSISMDEDKPKDSFPNTFVPGRNLFFLSIAAVFAREQELSIWLREFHRPIIAVIPIAGIRSSSR